MYIAVYHDYGESADGHTRLCGAFGKASEASDAVTADMVGFMHIYEKEGFKPYAVWEKREIWRSAEEVGEVGCVWDILQS